MVLCAPHPQALGPWGLLMPERWTLTRIPLPELINPALVATTDSCCLWPIKRREGTDPDGSREKVDILGAWEGSERCTFCNSHFSRIKSTPWNGGFSTRGHSAISGDIFGYHNWGLLLASSGKRPGVLLNIPQCTGQHSPTPDKGLSTSKRQ